MKAMQACAKVPENCNKGISCEVSSFYGGEYEDDSLLGYIVV